MSVSNNWMERIVAFVLRHRSGPDKIHASHLEVERKFRLTQCQIEPVRERIVSLGFGAASLVFMTDYFLPTENEGDMMRVRFESEQDKKRTCLTQKSWVGTSDGGRERKETESEIPTLVGSLLILIGRCLKGSELLTFSKHRQLFEGKLSGLNAVVSLDRVDNLGPYSGHYLEVEILVPIQENVAPARERIADFARAVLGEGCEPVEMSYMNMLKRSLELRAPAKSLSD